MWCATCLTSLRAPCVLSAMPPLERELVSSACLMCRVTTDLCILQDPVWLGNVRCSDKAEILDQCTRSDWGASGCDHSHDVGVVCIPGQSL